MKTHHIHHNVSIEVFPGEIVQLMGHAPVRYLLVNGNMTPKIECIASGQDLHSQNGFEVKQQNTVAELIETWLADASMEVEETMRAFGLIKYADQTIASANKDIKFRLNMLRAVLSGAEVIEVGITDTVAHVAALITNATTYAEKVEKAGFVPAFVVSEEGESEAPLW
jgi:hypothetical protein